MVKEKKDTGFIGVNLDKKTIDTIKQEARKQSFEKKEDITVSDLIRSEIYRKYGGKQ